MLPTYFVGVTARTSEGATLRPFGTLLIAGAPMSVTLNVLLKIPEHHSLLKKYLLNSLSDLEHFSKDAASTEDDDFT